MIKIKNFRNTSDDSIEFLLVRVNKRTDLKVNKFIRLNFHV